MTTGQHLIKGQWVNGPSSFESETHQGTGHNIQRANTAIVDCAAEAASQAFQSFGFSSAEDRAKLLRTIASEINTRGDEITSVCGKETGLPSARLVGERGRTTQQLELFASYIEQGNYLQRSVDKALPERSPIPRPELKKTLRPYGPVAVFGASNFPLAFSTAGGDTASALAAGCPVVVKGHPAHPATSELVAQAISAAIKQCDMDPGIFSLIQDDGIEAAQHLVTHPKISAVGFTGSLKAGRALFDLCNQRAIPIPFYGEMGSINPVFVLPDALAHSCHEVATGWVDSLNLGVGQFCTKPGLLFIPQGEAGDAFIETAKAKLENSTTNQLLTKGIATAYVQSTQGIKNTSGVTPVYSPTAEVDAIHPNVFTTSAATWFDTPELHQEIFGPYALIVRTANHAETLKAADALEGQLTSTLFITEQDHEMAKPLLQILEQKAGRILANGFPTGVEVAESMVHGGPYPASTFVGTTSVGTTAIQRFLRPVCYQNIPTELLPAELQHNC